MWATREGSPPPYSSNVHVNCHTWLTCMCTAPLHLPKKVIQKPSVNHIGSSDEPPIRCSTIEMYRRMDHRTFELALVPQNLSFRFTWIVKSIEDFIVFVGHWCSCFGLLMKYFLIAKIRLNQMTCMPCTHRYLLVRSMAAKPPTHIFFKQKWKSNLRTVCLKLAL